MLFEIYREKGFLLGIWKIEESVDTLKSLLSNLHIYFYELNRLTSEKRQKEWLAVRVLLNEMLGEEKQILYHLSGKPYLADDSFYLSISHTAGYAAVALHTMYEVGVDIEKCSERVCKVCTKFIHPEENRNIRPDRKVRDLLLHWCAKETIYKLMDISGTELKEHIRVVSLLPDTNDGYFEVKEYKTGKNSLYKVYYKVNANFMLTFSFVNIPNMQ